MTDSSETEQSESKAPESVGYAPPGVSQSERAERVPLVTGEATVTNVRALDEDRADEIRRAVHRILDEHGLDPDEAVGDGEIDWDAADERLATADVSKNNQEKLDRLRERYERPYPSLAEVAIDADDEIDYVPGQYVTLEFHDTPRPYSIASSPNEDDLSFCIRRVPGGALTPDLTEHLEPGDEIVVRGPNGEFTLQKPSARDVVFLATGTGIAPLRAMIRYLFEEGRDVVEEDRRDVWLVHGSSWRDDLAYREEFRALAEDHDNFHFVPTLSREPILSNWEGETAYVQHTFLKYLDAGAVDADLDDAYAEYLDAEPATDVDARMDPSNLEVYACGVSAMVDTLTDVATAVGVPDDRIAGEGFG